MTTPEPLRSTCSFCGAVIDPVLHARTIVEQVAAEHHVPLEDVYGRSRKAYIVAARACAIRCVREGTDLRLIDIGDLFGLKSHATILHHLNGNGARDAAAAQSGGKAN